MSEPVQTVAVDPSLSSVGDPDLTLPHDEVSQSEKPADSADQSDNVPRETADVPRETDPVSQAVETAVRQWIGFDPAIHAVNEDGTPRLRVDGSYARKRGRGGRKSGPDADTSGETDLFGDSVPRETAGSVPRETLPGATATAPQATPVQTAPNLSSQQAADRKSVV
jgi:hypothetical protein